VRFEWDPLKAEGNLRRHGVSFAEAVTVLEDDSPSPAKIPPLSKSRDSRRWD
jgi:uncharacterized DUF497 family protein